MDERCSEQHDGQQGRISRKSTGNGHGVLEEKNEPKAQPAIDEKAQCAIDVAALIIDLQFQRARDLPGFDELFFCPFVRGYLSGAFMAAMQAFKLPGCGEDIKTIAFIVGGHVHIMGEKSGFTYAMDSTRLQGNRDYDFGNRTGGQELIDFLNKRVIVHPALQLLQRHLMNIRARAKTTAALARSQV